MHKMNLTKACPLIAVLSGVYGEQQVEQEQEPGIRTNSACARRKLYICTNWLIIVASRTRPVRKCFFFNLKIKWRRRPSWNFLVGCLENLVFGVYSLYSLHPLWVPCFFMYKITIKTAHLWRQSKFSLCSTPCFMLATQPRHRGATFSVA